MNFFWLLPMTLFLTFLFLKNQQKVPLFILLSFFYDFILYSYYFYHLLIFGVLLLLSIYLEKKKISRYLQMFIYTSIYYLYFLILFKNNILLLYVINLVYNSFITYLFFRRNKIAL